MKTKAVTISLLLFSFVCLTSCSNTTYSGAYPFSIPRYYFHMYMSYKRGFPLKKDMHCVTKYVELLYP